eukprot:9491662-Pyramimonas_sp.AAC.1
MIEICENLAVQFAAEVQSPEARASFGFQVAMENTHSETQSFLLEQCISDPAEKGYGLRCDAYNASDPGEGRVGSAVDDPRKQFRRAARCLCGCGGQNYCSVVCFARYIGRRSTG